MSRWGFNRRERIAICILILALLVGIAVIQIHHRMLSQNPDDLTPEDSIAVSKLAEFTQTLKESPVDSAEAGAIEKLPYSPFPININKAAAAELEALPGIGPVLAERIINYRQLYGPFTAIDSLINVSGIGKRKLSKITGLITIQNSRGED